MIIPDSVDSMTNRGAMRVLQVCAVGSAVAVAGCDLGVVDYSQPPSPATMVVTSSIESESPGAERAAIEIGASLNPGIGPDGAPRVLLSESFIVEDSVVPRDTTAGGFFPPTGPARPRWRIALDFPAPGPEGVRLTLPRPEGLGPAQSLSMRVRVATTPEGVIRLTQGEDLVLTAERPSNPEDQAFWEVTVTAENEQTLTVRLAGETWPDTIRVPASQLPANGFPYLVEARIGWTRGLTLVQLTPAERYDLALTSVMRLRWTVEVE